jgi:multimeric flavodoxin WrbA
MRRLLIVWWSRTGASRQLAQAAAQGARGERRIETMMRRCDRVGADLIRSADAVLWVFPETLGGPAGMIKDLFDRTYYEVLGRTDGRAYGMIVCAGSDGRGAIAQVQRIMTGWRMKPVAEPIRVVVGAQTPASIAAAKTVGTAPLAQARELGAAMAAGLALGLW